MKPRAATPQCELFGARLSERLNSEHPRYVLAERIDWSQFDAAIEPTIGHMKSDNRMDRNHLTGQVGDKINTLLAAAGYNLRKLLRWVVFAPLYWFTPWLMAMLASEIGRRREPLRPALI